MARVYDVKAKRMLPATINGRAGIKSLISWDRLSKLLTEHDCGPREEITHLEIDDDGIMIGYGPRNAG